MPLDITDMLGLAATLIFAIPAALLGIEFVADGRVALGVTLLAVGVLMVVVPRVVPSIGDVPGLVLGRGDD